MITGHSTGNSRRGRLTLLAVIAVGVTYLGLAASALAGSFPYFSNYACCSGRLFAGHVYLAMANAISTGGSEVVCVQEQVFPNWPSQNWFYDSYKCGNGSTSHTLNGGSEDNPFCWVQGSTNYYTTCTVDY
jgi:hypothetical protein